MRVLSWLTDHFFVKMPQKKKNSKKPKKGDSVIELSPAKKTVTKRKAVVDNKSDSETTPSKTRNKVAASKQKTTPTKPKARNGKKLTLKVKNGEQIDNLEILDTEFF